MIKSFTASTCQIDDAEAAIAEITAKLDFETKLLKNTLGIISCFSEFRETGVLKAICDALPFDCIGTSSCICATGGEVDQIILAITVLTSDDCFFDTAVIPVTHEDYKDSIRAVISAQRRRIKEKPTLILGYFPLMNNLSGDIILSELDSATEGIPIFGTMAVDHKTDYSTAITIRNGDTYREAIVIGAVYGNLKVAFEIASLDENKIMTQTAIITGSEGNILTGVNGKTALEYLGEIGLKREDLMSGVGITPLVVDHRDGTKPVARAVFTLTHEGRVVCGGAMPVNATLALGRINMHDVLDTTEKALHTLIEKDCVILSYSCIARYLTLGVNYTAEAEKIIEVAGDEANYLFAHSGGEICPLPDENGKLVNYFHNFTNVFCRLS